MPLKIRAFCDIGKRHKIEVEDEVTAFLEYPDGCTGLFVTSTGEAPGTNRLEIAADNGKLVYEGHQIMFTRNLVPAEEFLRTYQESFVPARRASGDVHLRQSRRPARPPSWKNFDDAILTGAPLIEPRRGGHSIP
jgi:predicted dehydrogenase